MILCEFCNKECKSDNSQRNHQRLCKDNPDRQIVNWITGCAKGQGDNHFTRAKKLGLAAPLISKETRKKLSDNMLARTSSWNAENGKKISKTINEKVADGSWHTSLAKHMHYDYNGVDLHGTWELEYAKYLDLNNIQWIRNKDSFAYTFDGKERKYTPDFYLITDDVYIEIKGYKTEKDDAKWSQFPTHRTLRILLKNDLLNLGIKIKT